MLSNKKLIIFDMDGCLVDSENMYTEIWLEIFEDHGIDISREQVISWRGLGWAKIRQIINETTKDDAFTVKLRKERMDKFYESLAEGRLKLKPYAKEFMDKLIEQGKSVAVGTSTYKHVAGQILEHFNLVDKLDKIVYGDSVERTKPFPDIYLEVIDNFNFEKNEVIIFEDSGSGIKAANNAGIDVIYVPDGPQIDMSDLKILKVIESFNEVM